MRNAKRRLTTPAKKMPWEIRLESPKVFHELPKPAINFSKQDFESWRSRSQPELEKSTDVEPTHFPMPKMAKRAPKIPWEARLTAQRAASIAKWKTVVGISMKSFQIGIQLANDPRTDLGDVLDDVLYWLQRPPRLCMRERMH